MWTDQAARWLSVDVEHEGRHALNALLDRGLRILINIHTSETQATDIRLAQFLIDRRQRVARGHQVAVKSTITGSFDRNTCSVKSPSLTVNRLEFPLMVVCSFFLFDLKKTACDLADTLAYRLQ